LIDEFGRENVVIEVNSIDVPFVGIVEKPDYDKYV